MASQGSESYSFYLVMDFEATCEKGDREWPNEIIEFPAVLVDARTTEILDEFQRFVRPTENTELTSFCTTLTTIEQSDVDSADTLDVVLNQFDDWLQSHGIVNQEALPVFCGDWDLRSCLPKELKRKEMFGVAPPVLQKWCNIKGPFQSHTGISRVGMDGMLKHLDLELDGTHHRGIDDSRNIYKIMKALIERGEPICHTSSQKKKKLFRLTGTPSACPPCMK